MPQHDMEHDRDTASAQPGKAAGAPAEGENKDPALKGDAVEADREQSGEEGRRGRGRTAAAAALFRMMSGVGKLARDGGSKVVSILRAAPRRMKVIGGVVAGILFLCAAGFATLRHASIPKNSELATAQARSETAGGSPQTTDSGEGAIGANSSNTSSAQAAVPSAPGFPQPRSSTETSGQANLGAGPAVPWREAGSSAHEDPFQTARTIPGVAPGSQISTSGSFQGAAYGGPENQAPMPFADRTPSFGPVPNTSALGPPGVSAAEVGGSRELAGQTGRTPLPANQPFALASIGPGLEAGLFDEGAEPESASGLTNTPGSAPEPAASGLPTGTSVWGQTGPSTSSGAASGDGLRPERAGTAAGAIPPWDGAGGADSPGEVGLASEAKPLPAGITSPGAQGGGATGTTSFDPGALAEMESGRRSSPPSERTHWGPSRDGPSVSAESAAGLSPAQATGRAAPDPRSGAGYPGLSTGLGPSPGISASYEDRSGGALFPSREGAPSSSGSSSQTAEDFRAEVAPSPSGNETLPGGQAPRGLGGGNSPDGSPGGAYSDWAAEGSRRSSLVAAPPGGRETSVAEQSDFSGERSSESVKAVGLPGDPRLSGPQSPRLTIEKIAPEELLVGKPAVIYIRVSNRGDTPAENVEIHDWVPRGTRLVATRPEAMATAEGQLVWKLGTVAPQQEVAVEMEVLPVEEGEGGSVAEVVFSAPAGTRFRITKPELELRILAPEKVLIGAPAELVLRVSNPGSGPASQVVVEAHLPDGLSHPAGQAIMYEVGPLAPGETREVRLALETKGDGKKQCRLVARGEPNLRVVTEVPIEVTAPQLEVALTGSRRRYLERQAPFELTITNKGTAPARQVRLSVILPQGVDFVSANNNGMFDPATRRIRWQLEELPVGETGSTRFTILPRQLGRLELQASAEAERAGPAQASLTFDVEGIAALQFQVADKQDPIALGAETVYEIRLTNAGSKKAAAVRVLVHLPPGLRPLNAEAPVRYVTETGRIVFDALPELPPRAEVVYKISVQAIRPGDQRVRVEVTSDELRTPLTKEENTHVYAEE